jgi:hypothetical protein
MNSAYNIAKALMFAQALDFTPLLIVGRHTRLTDMVQVIACSQYLGIPCEPHTGLHALFNQLSDQREASSFHHEFITSNISDLAE